MANVRNIVLVAGLVGSSLLFVAESHALDKVTLGLPQAVGVHNADLGFGVKLGIFAEEGIELKLIGFDGSGRTVPQVSQGTITAALAHPDLVLQALNKGEPFPVTYVYNWRRRSPYEIAVKESSPLKTLADLRGKKLGVGAMTWANLPMTRAALSDLGIRWQQDVTIVPVGVGPAAWRQLDTGAIDAVNYYTAEHEKIRQAGFPLRLLEFPESYKDMFTNGLLVHKDMITKNPGLVERMGRALAKLTVACVSNIEKCVTGAWELDPTLKPDESKRAEWIETNARIIKVNMMSTTEFGQGQARDWGRYPDKGWQTQVKVLAEGGLVKESLDPTPVYTNSFVTAFNKFDAAQIAKRVQDLK